MKATGHGFSIEEFQKMETTRDRVILVNFSSKFQHFFRINVFQCQSERLFPS